MSIPESFISTLIDRTDVVEVVGRHVQLKKAGANFLGLCPFHGEKSPSFTVSPAKQFYHCFGCGVSGNAIKFLMESHGLGQGDLPEVASQGVMSELLRGKRELNLRQVKALATRFKVPVGVFVD